MKKFKFRLQNILMIRDVEKSKALQEYTNVVRKRHLVEAEKNECLENIKNIKDSLKKVRENQFFVTEQHYRLSWMKSLQERVAYIEDEIKKIKLEEDKMHKIFEERKKDFDIIARYQEKEEECYMKEIQHEEEKIIDDIILSHINRD